MSAESRIGRDSQPKEADFLPQIAGGSGESGESKSAYRRAVSLCFEAQDEARRIAVIEELMAAGVITKKPGRKMGRR